MKKILLLLLLNLVLLNVFSQKLNWVQTYGGKGYDYGKNILIDPFGNSIVMGVYDDTCYFSSTHFLVSKGYKDVFISKVSPSGQLLWIYDFGNNLNNAAESFTSDQDGNIYVSGNFEGLIDFNPGPGLDTLSSWIQSTGFVLKINANGNFEWVKRIGGYYENNLGPNGAIAEANLIKYDHQGALIIGGRFEGVLDFNFSNNKDSIIQGMGNYILKIDLSGNFNWVRIIRNLDYNEPFTALETYKNGDIISSGVFARTTDFDLGPDTFWVQVPPFSSYNFVLKLKSNGDFVWVKSLLQKGYMALTSIHLDQDKKIIVSGNYADSLIFSEGSNPKIHYTNNQSNGFVGIFTDSFQHIHSYSIESNRNNFALSTHSDQNGGIYLSGFLLDKFWVSKPNQTDTFFTEKNKSIFLLKLDSSAMVSWAKILPGEGNLNETYYVNITAFNKGSDQFYYTGFFRDSSDFVFQKSAKKISRGGFDILLGNIQFCQINLAESQNKSVFEVRDTARFTCLSNLSGSSYQWQQLLQGEFTNINDDTLYAGTKTSTLTIQSISLKEKGKIYRCFVMNDSCNLTSNQFNLTINCPELIDTIILQKELNIEQNAYLIAKSNAGFSCTYEWQVLKNGEFIGIPDSIGISGRNTDSLIIEPEKVSSDSLIFRLKIKHESCIQFSKPILYKLNCNFNIGQIDSIVYYDFLDTIQLIIQTPNVKSFQWEYYINGSFKNIPLNNSKFIGSKNDTLLIVDADGLMMEREFRCLLQNGICRVYSPVVKTRLNQGNSIIEPQHHQLLEIFPNPVNTYINFNSLEKLEGLEFEIFDTKGQLSLKGNIANNKQIDIKPLNKGLYFMVIKGLNHQALKFIVE